MAFASCSSIRIGGVLLAALTLCLAGSAQPASAQGLFQALFGGFQRRAPEPLPPQTNSYADPLGLFGNQRPAGEASGFGHGMVYCVRTCDGRYFPLQRHAGTSPAELCKSFCPAAKTMVFSGSKIDHAVARNGMRYGELENAFAYRDRVVESCTCNGRDGLGLAHLNAASDPTLRPGDIVATNNGFVSYRGSRAKNASKSAQFTPINPASSAWARSLSETRIRPAPPTAAAEPMPPANQEVSAESDRERRRAQLDR